MEYAIGLNLKLKCSFPRNTSLESVENDCEISS